MKSTDKKSLYIIIVTYNGNNWIERCLKSVEGFNTIIIDNSSKDNTVEIIRQKFPNFKLCELNKNLGFGRANNIGISLAIKRGAESVFLLNQDAYLQPGTIEGLLAIQRKFPQFAILSPMHLNGKGDSLDYNFLTHYINLDNNPDLLPDLILGRVLKQVYQVPFVNAAAWLVSVDALKKVGGFDPIFFMYGEDDNLCQRIRYHGYLVGVDPRTYVYHDRKRVKEISAAKKKQKARIKFLVDSLNIYNQAGDSAARNQLINIKRDLQKDLLGLRIRSFLNGYRLYKRFKRLYNDAQQIKEVHRIKGSHYLEIE